MPAPVKNPARREVMGGCVLFVLGILFGAALGTVLVHHRERQPQPVPDYSQTLTVRREDEPAVSLVPYAISIDGASTRLRPIPAGPKWVIHYDGPRVQVAYSEEVPK